MYASYPIDEKTEKECPFCCEYGIEKKIEFYDSTKDKVISKELFNDIKEFLYLHSVVFNNKSAIDIYYKMNER